MIVDDSKIKNNSIKERFNKFENKWIVDRKQGNIKVTDLLKKLNLKERIARN